MTADRPQLKQLMAALTHGDVVIILPLTASLATRPTCWSSPARCGAPDRHPVTG